MNKDAYVNDLTQYIDNHEWIEPVDILKMMACHTCAHKGCSNEDILRCWVSFKDEFENPVFHNLIDFCSYYYLFHVFKKKGIDVGELGELIKKMRNSWNSVFSEDETESAPPP